MTSTVGFAGLSAAAVDPRAHVMLHRRPEEGGATVAARLAGGPLGGTAVISAITRAFARWALGEDAANEAVTRCTAILNDLPASGGPVELRVTLTTEAVRVELACGADRASFDVPLAQDPPHPG